MKIGNWNVRTLNDTNTAVRRTTLRKYNIDIACLEETLFADSGRLDDAGYSYVWSRLPETDMRIHGVGIVMKTAIAERMTSSPRAINARLMVARVPLKKDRFLTIISAYAPTMTHDDASNEGFYEELGKLIDETPEKDKLVIGGDFNARVGRAEATWDRQVLFEWLITSL